MGLFDNKTPIEKAVKEICSNNAYQYGTKLAAINFTPYVYIFKDEDLLAEVLYKFSRAGVDVSVHLDYVSDMFSSLCIENAPEEKKIFKGMLDLYLKNPEIFLIDKSFFKVVNAFDDKKIVLEYFRYLSKNENILENTSNANLAKITKFIIEARQYFVDDRALLSAVISLVDNFDPVLLKYGDNAYVEKIIEAKLMEAKKANGIYNIDQGALAEMDTKLDTILNASRLLETLIQTAEQQSNILREDLKNSKSELTQAKIKELAELQKKANKILKDFNANYLELISQQRESLVSERDSLMAEVNREVEKAKTELLSIADGVGKRITIELGRITNGGNEAVRRLQEFVESNDDIKKLLSEAKSNDDFLTRLAQIEKLTGKIPGVSKDEEVTAGSVVIPKSTEVFVPNIIIPGEERVVDPKVCYFFDKNIPFRDRFAELMALKEKDMKENGSIYHESFDDSAKLLMVGKTPYLIGPSGCGKTYAIEDQMAKLFGLKVVTDSYITFEQSVLGYTNSGNGAYVPSNFYRCYKYGDIYFLDEIDNGIANATIILNKFMGSSKNSFTFPDGVTIQKHPNFRIVTAGNTKGAGRTLAYNTRQKLDEATMQRMIPVEFGYDNRIEQIILKDYPGWYDFAVNFRKAVERVPSDSGEEVNSIGIFTTRDAESVRTYLDDGVFDDRKIMEYEIVQTKDQDYLAKIGKSMQEQRSSGEFKTREGGALLDLFEEVCEEKKAKVRCKKM